MVDCGGEWKVSVSHVCVFFLWTTIYCQGIINYQHDWICDADMIDYIFHSTYSALFSSESTCALSVLCLIMHFHLIFRNDHIHASGCEQTNTVSSTDLVLFERINWLGHVVSIFFYDLIDIHRHQTFSSSWSSSLSNNCRWITANLNGLVGQSFAMSWTLKLKVNVKNELPYASCKMIHLILITGMGLLWRSSFASNDIASLEFDVGLQSLCMPRSKHICV